MRRHASQILINSQSNIVPQVRGPNLTQSRPSSAVHQFDITSTRYQTFIVAPSSHRASLPPRNEFPPEKSSTLRHKQKKSITFCAKDTRDNSFPLFPKSLYTRGCFFSLRFLIKHDVFPRWKKKMRLASQALISKSYFRRVFRQRNFGLYSVRKKRENESIFLLRSGEEKSTSKEEKKHGAC